MTTTTAPAPMTPFMRWKDWVTKETTGGALLLGAALIALIWANTPWGVTSTTPSPASTSAPMPSG